ncbi:DPH2 [Candida pseudojiufengensis]|uniref:DPH2 n=1 Tax=Candida pseudojiufengensis TaxID=497109 RepID=UPI0022244FA2|nr:DPH2 [Candida pseudojiufengensis]KAI5965639.1 DPH2 [Candida pseudojiufengensis]
MPSETVAVAPSLSTYQDDSTFSYDKVNSTKHKRQHLKLNKADDYTELVEKITEYYSIEELIKVLKNSKYEKITLQFPDELICDSATIVHILQEQLPNLKFWILADTSYSSCCVDEVAAEHVNSDLVIHFGDACLNEVAKINAIYVLGKPDINLNELVSQFKEKIDKDDRIVLMADAPHTHILHELKKRLRDYSNIILADLIVGSTKIIGYQPTTNFSHTQFNRTFSIDKLSDYNLFHITKPEAPRLLQLSTNFASVTTYDPITNKILQGPFPNLMRRYRYVHMVRSSGTIGILVNTLSLSNTKQLINTIKSKITQAGKKAHILVVGKPNVAKLANFDSIDIWCVLGCDHKGIIIDQTNEFYKPIVTPYELLLGLSDEVTWTGRWVTDYKTVIDEYRREGEEHEFKNENENGETSSDEEPEFDPVRGRYVSTSKPLRQIHHLSIKDASENDQTENALAERLSSKVAIRNTVSTSAMHLQNRHWTGLGSDYKNNADSGDSSDDDDEGAIVQEGRQGIARGYDYDIENK